MPWKARIWRSIRFRLNALFVLLVTTVMVISGVVSYRQSSRELLREDERERLSVKTRLETNLQLPVWNLDDNAIRQNLSAELNDSVRGILVRDTSGQAIAFVGSDSGADERMRLEIPLVFNQAGVTQPIGQAMVSWSQESMQQKLRRQVHQRALEIALLNLGLIVVLWISLRLMVLKPLGGLRQALERAASQPEQIQDVVFRIDRDDEFGEVTRAFNRIARRLADDLDRVRAAESEARKAYSNLKSAQATLVQSEKLAALGSLVAGVAHELNTPLGNALTVASTLHEKCVQFGNELESGAIRRSNLSRYVSESTQACALLMRSLTQAGELVASFKQVAVDQTSAKRRMFDLKEVVEEVLSTLRHMIRRKPIVLRCNLAENVAMDSYPGPFGQVLNNLFTNALVHAFEGRPRGEIVIEARADGEDWVVLLFADDGNGIAQAHLAKIFDPFFTTKLGRGGSGLGLNIVHNIVINLLGGSIEVESSEGHGTRFTVRLPRVAPRPASAVATADTA